jgi:hypothetical protein
LQQITGFAEQVGKNTDYVIHPEEILADNFALLISAQGDPISPEIIRKMEEVLKGKGTAKPGAPGDARGPRR